MATFKRRRSLAARAAGKSGGLDKKIGALADLLVSAKNLVDVSQYFHNVLVPDVAFSRAGEPAQNEQLVGVIEAVLHSLDPNGTLIEPLLIHIPEHEMWHGPARWGDGHALLLYFGGPDIGLCCYARALTDPRTAFARFSVARSSGTTLPGRVTRGQA